MTRPASWQKGVKSAGVARQYSGTAGRIENAQVGVFLSYVGPRGRALVDRELYLPKEWAEDLPRRREAGIGDDVTFATKPELAGKMLARTLAGGLTASWVSADEVYGHNPGFRAACEELDPSYILAAAVNEHVWVDTAEGPRKVRVDASRRWATRSVVSPALRRRGCQRAPPL